MILGQEYHNKIVLAEMAGCCRVGISPLVGGKVPD